MSFFKSLFKRNPQLNIKEDTSSEYLPYSVNPKEKNPDLPIIFAEKFTSLKGKFFYCENEQELIKNLETIFSNENINFVFCKEEPLFDLLTNFDVGFTEFSQDNPDAILLRADYLETQSGKIYISNQSRIFNELEQKCEKIVFIANESHLIDGFINLYNEYYSIQNQNQFTTFSIYKKEIILIFLETNTLNTNE